MRFCAGLFVCLLSSAVLLACSGAPTEEAPTPALAPPAEIPAQTPIEPAIEPVTADPRSSPDAATEAAEPVPDTYRELASFGAQTCGLRTDGHIRCWTTFVGRTVEVAEGVFEHLGQGAAHVCGITAEGAIGCPPGPFIDPMAQNGPIGIPRGGPFSDVTGGHNFRCALERTGAIRCSGGNALMTPRPPTGSYVAIAAGGSFVCGLTRAGRAECSTADGSPVELPGGPFVALVGSEYAACGLRRGDGAAECSHPVPGGDTELVGFTQLAVGLTHRCGLRDGGVHCWGMMIDPADFPPPGDPAEHVTVGQETCLLRADGSVGCWGMQSVTLRMP